ncbi:MAG: hypothetical protein HN367_05030 [Candidatus Marinimicrobia bacterium]|nr:hypothetical protein [Candidatus Neomarinimicrobiota bacterium]MBT3683757.1 hypothetical protein [Candidatus Neomarinimicrobiota bacterium]
MWHSPNFVTTNESGFTAIPGGLCASSSCYDLEYRSFFWTSIVSHNINSWLRILSSTDSDVGRVSTEMSMGFSVRCIRD